MIEKLLKSLAGIVVAVISVLVATGPLGSQSIPGLTPFFFVETVSSTPSAPVNVIFSTTPASDAGGWNNFTLRTVYAAASLTPSGAPTQLRLNIQGGSFEGVIITEAYVGAKAAAGDAYDFATTPIQLTWSGSAGTSIMSSATVTSDWVNFAYNGTSGIVVALYMNGGAAQDEFAYRAAVGNVDAYFVAGNDAATVNTSGYTLQVGRAYIKQMETR